MLNIYTIIAIIVLLAFVLMYFYKDKIEQKSFVKDAKEMFETKGKSKKIILK